MPPPPAMPKSVSLTRKRGRTWTPEQLRRARTATVMDGRVFDTSAIAPLHPGGAAIVRKYVGRDMSDAYRRVRHSSRATEWLEMHCVGKMMTDGAHRR